MILITRPHMKRSHATGGTLTRRSFLAGAAAMAGGLAACRTRTAIPVATGGQASLRHKLNLAVIGAGGRGADNLRDLAATGEVNIVALCDCDSRRQARRSPSIRTRRGIPTGDGCSIARRPSMPSWSPRQTTIMP